jgi:hypothetical protein
VERGFGARGTVIKGGRGRVAGREGVSQALLACTTYCPVPVSNLYSRLRYVAAASRTTFNTIIDQ